MEYINTTCLLVIAGCSAASLGYLLGAREHLIATADNIERLCMRAEDFMDEASEAIEEVKAAAGCGNHSSSDEEPRESPWIDTIDDNYDAGFSPSVPASHD